MIDRIGNIGIKINLMTDFHEKKLHLIEIKKSQNYSNVLKSSLNFPKKSVVSVPPQ